MSIDYLFLLQTIPDVDVGEIPTTSVSRI